MVMDLPTEGGMPTAMHEGEVFDVTIQRAGQRLGFRARVKGRCFHQVREGTWVPAVIMSNPEEVEIRQRRTCYRVELSKAQECEVVFGRIETGVDRTEPSGLSRGVVEDLSAGGMGIRCREGACEALGVGTRVRLFFQLPGKGAGVALAGEIRNRRAGSDGRTVLGVEFVETQRSLEERKGVGVIGQYVAARQREMLRTSNAT